MRSGLLGPSVPLLSQPLMFWFGLEQVRLTNTFQLIHWWKNHLDPWLIEYFILQSLILDGDGHMTETYKIDTC